MTTTTTRRPSPSLSPSLSLLTTILTILTIFLTSLPLASAHGFLKNIQVNNGKLYPAWQVGQDDFVKPAPPVRYARRLKDQGPVPDFTTKDITYAFLLYLPSPILFFKELDSGSA